MTVAAAVTAAVVGMHGNSMGLDDEMVSVRGPTAIVPTDACDFNLAWNLLGSG